MHTTTARRTPAGLLTMAFSVPVLIAAYLVLPRVLVRGGTAGLPHAFAVWWAAGDPELSAGLQHVVDRQFRSHLVTLLIALALVVVLTVLAVRWPRLRPASQTQPGPQTQPGTGVLWRRLRVPVIVLALGAGVLLISQVQGVLSPFGTLLPGLVSAPGESAAALAQVTDRLAHGQGSPALQVLIDEYVRWHVAKGALVGALTVVLAVLAVRAWRRRWVFGLLMVVPVLAGLLVTAANVTAVVNPIPQFLILFRVPGSW